MIHEFDPYFNYRTTKFLADEGFYKFHNWFDERAWYPLGRIIGGTIYPGLMVTSTIIYHILNFFHISIEVRNVCVFLAPFFSSLTSIVTYFLTSELFSEGAGLVAASMIAIVPGYISRSVAGSYDNEGIAIFCMLFTYYLWIKSVKTGQIYWAALCALAYFYMVSSWGGYVFLINLIPMHVFALMVVGRFTHRVYVAYSIVYCLGTILSMQIAFVGFQPVQTSEHMLVSFSIKAHTGTKIHILCKNSNIENPNFYKIHLSEITFFTKFTFQNSHFSQNLHFRILTFHKIHIFQTSNPW